MINDPANGNDPDGLQPPCSGPCLIVNPLPDLSVDVNARALYLTAIGLGGVAAPKPNPDPPAPWGPRGSGAANPFPKCNPSNAAIETNNLQFIKANYAAAEAVSAASAVRGGSNVPVTWIPGWAALESGDSGPEGNYYGTLGQAQPGYNNFFGEIGSGWNGQITCPTPTISTSSGTFACFASFQASASSSLFSFGYGKILATDAKNNDTASFAFQQVYNAGYNVGGNAGMMDSVVGQVDSMLNCLFTNNYM